MRADWPTIEASSRSRKEASRARSREGSTAGMRPVNPVAWASRLEEWGDGETAGQDRPARLRSIILRRMSLAASLVSAYDFLASSAAAATAALLGRNVKRIRLVQPFVAVGRGVGVAAVGVHGFFVGVAGPFFQLLEFEAVVVEDALGHLARGGRFGLDRVRGRVWRRGGRGAVRRPRCRHRWSGCRRRRRPRDGRGWGRALSATSHDSI